MEERNTHVLVTGSPMDGFTFYGPITPNDPQLEEFTDADLRDEYWWYATLSPLPKPARWVWEDEQNVAREVRPSPIKQQILVLVIESNHGDDISLHADEDSVNRQLRTFLAAEDAQVPDEQLHELLLGEEYGLIFRIDSYDDPRA